MRSHFLEATFLKYCLQPLRGAASLLAEGRATEAVGMLSREVLVASLEQAMDRTARAAWAPRSIVERAIELGPLRSAIEAVGEAQVVAHGSLGACLRSPTTLMPPAPQPQNLSTSERLLVLARSYALDTHIAVPVQQLAQEVAGLEREATQVAERLSQDQSLRATAQRRWLLAGAAIGLGIFVSLGVAGSVSWHRVVVAGARDRIDAALRAGDICAGETVSEHDLAQAREDQLQALAEARQRCDAKRAKQAHVTRCEQLAEHVVRGRLDAADQEAAEDAWPLLQRLAKGALQPEDLQIGHDAMPCADLPSGGILWSAYARAVGTAEAAWGQVETVSPPVRRLFEGRTIELSEGARRSLLSRTENVTKHAIKSGVEEELEQARRLCTLVAVVQPEPEPWCKALARIDRKRE